MEENIRELTHDINEKFISDIWNQIIISFETGVYCR